MDGEGGLSLMGPDARCEENRSCHDRLEVGLAQGCLPKVMWGASVMDHPATLDGTLRERKN